MLRARDRDQRLMAGVQFDPWLERMCMDFPLG
jgi:hypothetical protein